MPNNGVILVFTDEASAQLHLEQVITQTARTKNVKLFFALLDDPTKICGPSVGTGCLTGSASEQAYQRLSKGRIFRSSDGALDFDSKAFFDSVISHVNVITVFSILTGFSDTEYIFSAMTLTLLNRLD